MTPTKATGSQLVSDYDAFLFDADGVLWLGDQVIPGAVEAVSKLIGLGKQVFVITNNSTKTPAQFAEKFLKLGFSTLNVENVVSPALVTAAALASDPRSKTMPVYLIGTRNLAKVLSDAGVDSFGSGADNLPADTHNVIENVDLSRKVFAVVTSYDPHFSYVKLTKAVNYLKDPSVDFVATNEDKSFPTSVPGLIIPGAGCTSLSVKAICGREARVMGKPHQEMFAFITKRFKVEPSKALMVGDRCDTDILFGNSNNMGTLLVLTGVHDLNHVSQLGTAEAKMIPKLYAPSISVFVE